MLLPQPLIRHHGPSTSFVIRNEQASHDRWALHLPHYIPERHGLDFDVIKDVIPIDDVEVSVRGEQAVKSVALAPQGGQFDFTVADGYVDFTLPKLDGHQIIVIQV